MTKVIEADAAPAFAERAGLEELEAAVDVLADGLSDGPVLAPEALTRWTSHRRRG